MLNSRFAPTIAIAAVVSLLVLVAGYFLVISPQLSGRAEAADREQVVRDNIAAINESSRQIDSFNATLELVPDYTETIALHAPVRPELQDFQRRLAAAVVDSATEIMRVQVSPGVEVPGLVLPPNARQSSELAQQFQVGPVEPIDGEPGFGQVYEPVVTAVGEGAVVDTLWAIPVTVVVKGRPSEVARLLDLLKNEESRLFQITSVLSEARQEWDPPVAGISEFTNGDTEAVIEGYLFVLNPETSIIDEEEIIEVGLPGEPSSFEEPESSEPQPGAG